ncbi:MAG TPA: CNNM domain-containing protein, partial [Humisphaera sp.]
MPFPWSLLAVPVLILLNAFFVVAEYALVAIRPAQIDLMRPRRPRAAAAMAKLKADTASAIGAIQVCITMTNLLLGWIGEPALSELLLRILGPLAAV